MSDELLAEVELRVLGWPGTTSESGRFHSVAFRYGKREIGHVHRDRIADLPVTPEMREEVLSKGRAGPHRAGSKGYISYRIEDGQDVSAVLDILARNYERAKAAADRRATSLNDEA